jgi:hypothetical protein
VPKYSLSKYEFRASGVRTTASADRTESGLLPWFLSSVLDRPGRKVRRQMASRESFPLLWRWVSPQVCPENPRRPATQRSGRSGGEHGLHGNWRRKCDWVQTVSVAFNLQLRDPRWLRGPLGTENCRKISLTSWSQQLLTSKRNADWRGPRKGEKGRLTVKTTRPTSGWPCSGGPEFRLECRDGVSKALEQFRDLVWRHGQRRGHH